MNFTEEIACNPQLKQAIDELVEKYHARVEALTKEQFESALTQAIASGDFVRFVSQDGGKQSVVYIPGHGMDQLRERISELEKELAVLKSPSNSTNP